jgi:hypothetical protein
VRAVRVNAPSRFVSTSVTRRQTDSTIDGLTIQRSRDFMIQGMTASQPSRLGDCSRPSLLLSASTLQSIQLSSRVTSVIRLP